MATRRERTLELDGISLTILQHNPMDALRLNALLLKAVGPSLSQIVPALVTGKVQLERLDLAELGDAIKEIEPDLLVRVAQESLRCSEAIVDGKRIELTDEKRINLVFAGAYLTMLRAAWEAIRLNFADFTSLVPAGVLGQRAPTTETPSASE